MNSKPDNNCGNSEDITLLFKIIENSEITIEVNPGTVNKSILEEFKKAGINLLSIGIQSFKNNMYIPSVHSNP